MTHATHSYTEALKLARMIVNDASTPAFPRAYETETTLELAKALLSKDAAPQGPVSASAGPDGEGAVSQCGAGEPLSPLSPSATSAAAAPNEREKQIGLLFGRMADGFNLVAEGKCTAAHALYMIEAQFSRVMAVPNTPHAGPSDEDKKDAERFRYLQDLKPIEAQQFFWNHVSRKQRVKAIDEHMRHAATGGRE